MEQLGVVAGNFARVFQSSFCAFLCLSEAPCSRSLWSRHHWKDLVLLQKLNVDDPNFGQKWWRQKWKKGQASLRALRAVTGGYGRHRSQWEKGINPAYKFWFLWDQLNCSLCKGVHKGWKFVFSTSHSQHIFFHGLRSERYRTKGISAIWARVIWRENKKSTWPVKEKNQTSLARGRLRAKSFSPVGHAKISRWEQTNRWRWCEKLFWLSVECWLCTLSHT